MMVKYLSGFAGLMLLLTLNLIAQDSSGSYLVDEKLGFPTGPAISEVVPDFSLPDQFGQKRSLEELLGKKGAVLNFYRSASW